MRVKRKFLLKPVSLLMLVVMFYQMLYPIGAYALTGGPAQPETQAFAPISSSDMVDLFSGDFKYNIPLLDVGGYPVNLIYNSNPTMDEEASWVGLGWNLNPGAINRTLRGLPDDFDKDIVTKEYNIKDNKSWGVNIGAQIKILGLPFNLSGGVSANNYKGYGIDLGLSTSMSSSKGAGGDKSGSLGVNFSSQDGVSLSASAGISQKDGNSTDPQNNATSIGLGYNNRGGLKELTLSRSKVDKSDASYERSVGIASASISFATPTYTPTITMPLHSVTYNLQGTLGGEATIAHPGWQVSGFWSRQTLQSKKREQPAYGYLNSYAGSQDENALMDFNREKDVAYVKTIPAIPIPNFTYDLFSVSGQGVSGQFRAHRGDVGILFDSKISNGSGSLDAGIELGFGNAFHGAVPIQQVDVTTTTKKWSSTNSLETKMDFMDPYLYTNFENSYFKCVGEQSIADTDFYARYGNEEPIANILLDISCANKIDFDKYSIRGNNYLSTIPFHSPVFRFHRDRRSQLFSYLNAEEASKIGLYNELYTYKSGVFPYNPGCVDIVVSGRDGEASDGSFDHFPRTARPNSHHHISEISITKPDGKRYVYSIPAYNNVQKDVTFNCFDLGHEPSNGLVSYVPGTDNSTETHYGVDRYFNAETVPAYPYAFLLSGILSPDYIDQTGNGISFDDLGEAIKFNYTRVSPDYAWRVPCEYNSANYNGGLNTGNGKPTSSSYGDAKGTYIFGTKELWYMHSIESKTMLAMFYLEDRYDATGVADENGGPSSNQNAKQKFLKEIKLFSKSDIMKNGAAAIPVKTVHFVYDYSLCPNVSNNIGPNTNNTGQYSYYEPGLYNEKKGKLTLKKIYFTYGNNTIGQLNSYKFNYSNSNPNYGLKNYDRWGNYKNNPSDLPMNAEFPYTLQDPALTDNFSKAWNLEQIDLPSGGSIFINLESDDYAYVQDRRAGQMFILKGFGDESSPDIDAARLYNETYQYNRIYIKVDDSSGDLARKYFQDLTYIYYRCFVDLGNTGDFDYISGYAEIDRSGTWCGAIDSETIFVKVKRSSGNNPVSRNAWQFLRNNVPEVAYPGSSDPGLSLGESLLGLIGSITEIYDMVVGADDAAIHNEWAKNFDPTHSWVRLCNPTYKKLGGGSRVKSLVISDNWDNMAPDGSVKTYGQEYSYTDLVNGQLISTGVASWEPSIGNDENPFKYPLYYDIDKKLVEDDHFYMEEPFGESFFPSPSIGYGKVTVANLSNEHIRRTATGYTVSEFYTAKDFPVITARTNPKKRQLKPNFKLSLLGSCFSLERWSVSQGFMVEVNDMHGKEKAVTVFNSMNSEISSTRYYYREDNPEVAGKRRISNKANVVLSDGSIRYTMIGEDIDLAMDMREQTTETRGLGVTINLDSFLFGFLFLAIPMPIPRFTMESKKFRSAAAMKVIHRYGILDRVVATKDGSTIETRNLLRDSETGEVLLTQTQNEFSDSLYNLTYPAHWAYTNMGAAYTNTGLVLRDVEVTEGDITGIASPFDFLFEGDEIVAKQGQTLGRKYYVGRFRTSNNLRLMDGDKPATIAGEVDLKVIRSGKRNMQTLPIGTVSTVHQAPIDYSGTYPAIKIPDSIYVTQASATEFYDKWKINCSKILVNSCDTIHPEFCLDYLINQIISYNESHYNSLFNLCFDDSVTVQDLYNMCNCKCSPDTIADQSTAEMPFYNPTCPQDLSAIVNHSWSFGTCSLVMNSLSGNPVNLDSLQPIEPIDTSSNCSIAYIGVDHSDSVSFCVECISCNDSCVDQSTLNLAVSPYHTGMFNNWHVKKTYSYYSQRTPSAIVASRIRYDGTFNEFTKFWQPPSFHVDNWFPLGLVDDNWIATNTVTRINSAGADIENKDALDRYSAALYGYLETLPKAISSNTRYRQIANDNFEDYNFRTTCKYPCFAEHWNFVMAIDDANITISDAASHTGNYSLKINSGYNASVYRDINYLDDDSLVVEDTVNYQYIIHNGCLEKFSPDSGRYILSAWVKEEGLCGPTGYLNDSIVVSFSGSTDSTILFPQGVVIEGWQRYEGIFEVPPSADGITISLCAGANNTYFDDIRIHPYHSNMKSFVNDSRSLRLMSELDANNYATLYEYDDEGRLVRVKKETERGVMTLKESRSAYKK